MTLQKRDQSAILSCMLCRALCSVFVCLAALALSAFGLLRVPSADAAPGWLAPTGVSDVGHQVSEPQVAFDKHGDAVAVWDSADGTGKYGLTAYVVQGAFRPAGGAWQAPERLAWAGESGERPSVAFDGHGDAFAVWEAYTGYTFVVEAAYRPLGGGWGEPVELAPAEIPGDAHPRLAVDEQGDAIAIWNLGGPSGGAVQEAFKPAGGAWRAPVEVAEEGDNPEIAFDGNGNALALWYHFAEKVDGDYEWVAQSAFLPAGGSWGAPVDVSDLGLAGGLQMAVNSQGDAVAVWDQWTHGFLSARTVQAASRPAGSDWQAPVELVGERDELDQPKDASEPEIAVDGRGDAVAIWAWEFGETTIQTAFKPAGGTWLEPIDLSTFDEYAKNPDIAFDGQGDAIAVWSVKSSTGAPEIIQSAYKPAGSAWQTSVDLSGETNGGYDPQVAFDGWGDAVAAWAGENDVQSAGYVVAGPSLNDVLIPAEGTVGQPVTFSVSPFDVWSIDGEAIWNFGDGTSASGAGVTHIYASLGTYEVTVRSTDSLGNVASASGKVTIAPVSTTAPSGAGPTSSARTSGARTSGAHMPEPPTVEPPAIGRVSQSASVWRERGKSRVGTTFSIALNEQATIDFSFLRHVNGRVVGHKCVAETSRNAGRGVCRRTVPAGLLSLTGHEGMNMVGFSGLLSRSRQLTPSRYTLIITATNAAGQHSKAESLRFVIVV